MAFERTGKSHGDVGACRQALGLGVPQGVARRGDGLSKSHTDIPLIHGFGRRQDDGDFTAAGSYCTPKAALVGYQR